MLEMYIFNFRNSFSSIKNRPIFQYEKFILYIRNSF